MCRSECGCGAPKAMLSYRAPTRDNIANEQGAARVELAVQWKPCCWARGCWKTAQPPPAHPCRHPTSSGCWCTRGTSRSASRGWGSASTRACCTVRLACLRWQCRSQVWTNCGMVMLGILVPLDTRWCWPARCVIAFTKQLPGAKVEVCTSAAAGLLAGDDASARWHTCNHSSDASTAHSSHTCN